MKVLITGIALLLTVNSFGNVVCVKQGKYWRPSNEVSKDIAKSLRVKTCSGGKFRALVKKLGMTSNVPAASSRFNEAALLKKYSKKAAIKN